MSLFVLIHGSWHNGSAWDKVVRHLEGKGHKAAAPTMVGHGKNANRKSISHPDCTQSIAEFIVSKDLRDFVLVGHSFGGTVISKLAEQLPERIKRLVFWNAFVLKDGNSLNDEIPANYRQLFGELVKQSNDNSVMLPFPIWREAFINDADLELAKSTYAQLAPEPYQPLIDKLDLKRFYSLEIPRSYLNCTEDIALPPGEWGWHPRMSSRLGLCRLVQMPGSHETLFTNPTGLAERIVEAGRD
jgi:pimeloyl-ACP methyl ester carboxylesterase